MKISEYIDDVALYLRAINQINLQRDNTFLHTFCIYDLYEIFRIERSNGNI